MQLHDIRPVPGQYKNKKRVGRGIGSGKGKTAGRGHKGQKARKSPDIKPWFEGGQMPLLRRVPKRGFSNAPFARRYTVVTLEKIAKAFPEGGEITPELLLDKKVIKKIEKDGVKVIGKAELKASYFLKVHKVTKGARESVEKAGGKVEALA